MDREIRKFYLKKCIEHAPDIFPQSVHLEAEGVHHPYTSAVAKENYLELVQAIRKVACLPKTTTVGQIKSRIATFSKIHSILILFIRLIF